ncbi:AsmA family protein [Ramlibacter tataouinensis]|uniref:AsmA family protein n=1 Tax=Ramlibacter tataouinensis TaxID=94132 RepID=UPI0022F3881B|nr:AsmA family protein [Ramlibacter tataouinensis]WBY03380.1 AsmA family protein [Ramlibacter tataouinensis]
MGSAAAPQPLRTRRWFKVLLVLAAVCAALVLLIALFPWDLLRGPLNRYVSERTGRHFAITRQLDVKLGRTTRVLMDGVEFANPGWAQDPFLVKAERAEVAVRLLPLLLRRQIVLPSVHLARPQIGLQVEPDGRRTWALGGDTSDEKNVPAIGALRVDEGTLHYVARHNGADIRTRFAIEPGAGASGGQAGGPPMPLRFEAQGRWRDQPFRAEGRTGDVLYLSAPLQQPFPAQVQASIGGTQLHASGSVASLASLEGANVDFRLQGPNLAELYRLVGVTLPDTPRYAVTAQLSRQGEAWQVRGIDARLGDTDLKGELSYERSGPRPLLTGRLQSRLLDFEDLAPVIGLEKEGRGAKPPAPTPAKAPVSAKAAPPADLKAPKAPKDPGRKVLPAAPLDVGRLRAMDADVRVDAARVINAKGLPLDRMGVRVRLHGGVLLLDPLDLGVAGGRLAGMVRIDANAQPAAVQTRLDARGLELGRLVPRSESMRNSFGKIQGQIDLSARGRSVAQLLASADGHLALLMGKGQISNLLLEFAGLDGGEIMKFLVEGDNRVQLRCAATAFDVENGLMTSRALVLDTDDTVFYGGGTINLASEAMDLLIRPYPKDASILSVRSPLRMAGTFGAPQVGLDKGALAGRGALAIALGAINPLLALAATIETGPGHDADCAATLRSAAAPRAEARLDKGPAAAGSDGEPAKRMGAGPGAAGRGKPPAGAGAGTQQAQRPSARTPAQAADAGGIGRPGQPVVP